MQVLLTSLQPRLDPVATEVVRHIRGSHHIERFIHARGTRHG